MFKIVQLPSMSPKFRLFVAGKNRYMVVLLLSRQIYSFNVYMLTVFNWKKTPIIGTLWSKLPQSKGMLPLRWNVTSMSWCAALLQCWNYLMMKIKAVTRLYLLSYLHFFAGRNYIPAIFSHCSRVHQVLTAPLAPRDRR